MSRAPFAYYGGKSGMARRLVAMMPPHRAYIEPFFGSGAVLFRKPPSRHEIVNDIDGAVVTFFRVLREQPEELTRVCALSPHARDEFGLADLDDEQLTDLERARRFWVRINQSFTKGLGQSGWSITTARTQSVPATALSRITRFEVAAQRLALVTIENCDAMALVERLATSDTLIYADPPYVHATRRSGGRVTQVDYRHEMTDEDHIALAEVLHATPATVLLSGYPGDLYQDLYGEWDFIDVEVTAHSSNAAAKGRTSRTERIWSSRPIEGALDLWGSS